MRKIYSLLVITILLVSCGEQKKASVQDLVSNGTIKELRARKAEITEQLANTNVDLKSINDAISKLDSVKKLPLITTITCKEEVFKHYLEVQGNVKTKQNILVYPEIPGILEHIYIKEGQRVSKGQVLAKIADGGLMQQVAQAKASANLAKTTYERQNRLWNQKIGSEIQYLQAKTAYETQKNIFAQMKKQLAKSNVVAPFSGVIDDVLKEAGAVVAPGQGSELFRIVNLENMYIEAEIPESHIVNVTKGKTVEIYFPVLEKTIQARIRQVGNFINPANRAFKIEIGVPNSSGDIKPNLTAKLKINDYTSKKAILIPQSIISENAKGQQYVYLASDKQDNKYAIAKKTIISTGKTQGDFIEVLETIASGTEIISEGARSVNDGQKVEIKNQ